MPDANLSIVNEVEAAINSGSAEKRLDTVKRVTDLFLLSAGTLNTEQIELFDGVLDRLIKTIEIRAIKDISARIALAELSAQLAPVAKAPPGVIRRLSRNDEISVAGPVLTESARLNPIPSLSSKPASGSICHRSSAASYCATRQRRCDRGCCHAHRHTFSRKSEVRLRPSRRV